MVSHTLFVTEYGKDWSNGGDVSHVERLAGRKVPNASLPVGPTPTAREFLNEEVDGGVNPDRDMRRTVGTGSTHETAVFGAFPKSHGPTVSLTAVLSLQV
jgi:hypothetical protein